MTKETEGHKILSAGSAIPAILIATAITVSLLGYGPISRRVASTVVNVQATPAEQNSAASARFNWDVRLSSSVASVTESELVLNSRDGSTIRYAFDSRTHAVTRTKGTQASTILAGVHSVSFCLHESPASYQQMHAAAPANTRVVGLKWTSLDASSGPSNPQTAIATLQTPSR